MASTQGEQPSTGQAGQANQDSSESSTVEEASQPMILKDLQDMEARGLLRSVKCYRYS